jgi:hypothetical protein
MWKMQKGHEPSLPGEHLNGIFGFVPCRSPLIIGTPLSDVNPIGVAGGSDRIHLGHFQNNYRTIIVDCVVLFIDAPEVTFPLEGFGFILKKGFSNNLT